MALHTPEAGYFWARSKLSHTNAVTASSPATTSAGALTHTAPAVHSCIHKWSSKPFLSGLLLGSPQDLSIYHGCILVMTRSSTDALMLLVRFLFPHS